jgi:hypothetical protein
MQGEQEDAKVPSVQVARAQHPCAERLRKRDWVLYLFGASADKVVSATVKLCQTKAPHALHAHMMHSGVQHSSVTAHPCKCYS